MKILAFTMGDSNKASTWSNVPYYCLRELEEKGDIVYRENICLEDESKVLLILGKVFNRLVGTGKRGGYYGFDRTALYSSLVRRKMVRAYKKHSDAELLLTFDFSNSIADLVDIPTLLFCDWTIEYGVQCLKKRKPTFLEKIAIRRQNNTVREANYVVTLFPDVCDHMRGAGMNNVAYLGHIVNTSVDCVDMKSEDGKMLSARRWKSRNLLFIGRPAYLAAAKCLIHAVEKYNQVFADPLYVDIIGMTKEQLELTENKYICAHGYLNKDNPAEARRYYDLMNNAMFIVNTAEEWIGASSIIEAMYFGVPIVVTPNKNIKALFGEEINCGFYNVANSPECLFKTLTDIGNLDYACYKLIGRNAQKKVADYTWPRYISRLRELVTAGS